MSNSRNSPDNATTEDLMDEVSERIVRIPVAELELDPRNPRLPEELLGKSQSSILAWLEETSNLEELASSMIQNGFFDHEPLIVRKSSDGGRKYVVVEGNRRFATINIIRQLDAAREAELEFDYEVAPTSEEVLLLETVPCVVVETDDEVRKFLGFRHIGGVKTWSAEAKARYIEEEVARAVADGSENPFKEVGKRVGTNALGVRGPYIALRTLKVARDRHGLTDQATYVLRARFGVWNRLLNSAEVRRYIGLGDAMDIEAIETGLASLNVENLSFVLRDLVPEPGARTALLQDSRDITKYGRVIANEAARSALEAFRDLNIAAEIADGSTLFQKLRTITKSVDALMRSIDTFSIGPTEVEAAASLFNSSRSLNALVKDRLDGED